MDNHDNHEIWRSLNSNQTWPSPGSDDDRRWFRARPHRKHRLRRAYPDEVPDDRCGAWAIVRQARVGIRLRVIAVLDAAEPSDFGEANAQRLFEQAVRMYPLVAKAAEALR
jgi:hypothetical protein